MSVPVPARSPLGSEALDSVPLPRARVVPEDAAATVEVLGWSASQPATELEDLGPLLSRPRPPVASAAARAGWPELVLAGIAGAFLVRFRRRTVLALVLGLGSGVAVLELARSRRGSARSERVLEWDAAMSQGVSVRTAAEEFPLPRAWLEVTPAGRGLEVEWRPNGTGTVRAKGARLSALEPAAPLLLTPAENGFESLAQVWTRTAGGTWSARGAWPAGRPLAEASPDAAPDPPGWLASGLAPGRPVLLARTEAGAWLRCLGCGPE